MIKKLVLSVLILLVVAGVGLYFWAGRLLSGDAVRTAVEGQFSRALGQPVTIGRLHASIVPLAVTLDDVRIGRPARIEVGTLHVATSLRALLSRRIEHGRLRASHATIQLPLPPFAIGSDRAGSTGADTGSPLQIVSIDDIALDDVRVTSGGRTLTGSADAGLHGSGLTLRDLTLTAGEMTVKIAGEVTDLSGPAADLTVRAATLDLVPLLGFAADFTSGAVAPAANTTAAAGPTAPPADTRTADAAAHPVNIGLTLAAEHAIIGTLPLGNLSGHARLTSEVLAIDPVTFGVFGGTSKGSLGFTLGRTPGFRLRAALANIDMAAAMAFAGKPGVLSGRLTGTVDLSGNGTSAGDVVPSTHGTARVDVADGVVKNLGLIRAIVLATSMRADSTPLARRASASADEPFSLLGATLAIDGGTARTNDLEFTSPDVLLRAAGSLRLDGSAVDLSGDVQLSEALSKQAGRDLVRYTQQGGRATLPLEITGPADNVHVRIDLAETAKRAIVNRAVEEAKKALGLGR